MSFQSGDQWTGNANGRRPGSRNKRTQELWDLLSKRGDRDPVEFMSQLVSDPTIPLDTRVQAANNIAPYRHSKMGAVPPLRYIEEPFELPNLNPTTEAEISGNIAALSQALAAGRLDLDFYNALLLGQHQHISALKAREELPANQNIQITGGLPSLPGTNITMPTLATMNGHEILAPPDPPILPPQDPDHPPAIPPQNDPTPQQE